MDKKYIAFGLVCLNAIIQLASCFWYSDLPGFVWTLADSIVILVPLVFGLRMGLLNLLPVAVSEFVWFFKLGVPGPLLHLAAFTVAVLLMAAAHRRLTAMPRRKRAVLSGILFIAGLAGEELFTWSAAAGSAETGQLGRFLRFGFLAGGPGCSAACSFCQPSGQEGGEVWSMI